MGEGATGEMHFCFRDENAAHREHVCLHGAVLFFGCFVLLSVRSFRSAGRQISSAGDNFLAFFGEGGRAHSVCASECERQWDSLLA